jgi:hypothetical protein
VYLRYYVGELPIFHNIGDGPIKWFFLGEKKKKKKETKTNKKVVGAPPHYEYP